MHYFRKKTMLSKVYFCIATIQETCLVAMLRVSANCDEVPPDVIDIVKTITSTARRSVQAVRLTNDGIHFFIDRVFFP